MGVCIVRDMRGRGCAWQGGHAWSGVMYGRRGVRGRYYEIQSMSGRYAT